MMTSLKKYHVKMYVKMLFMVFRNFLSQYCAKLINSSFKFPIQKKSVMGLISLQSRERLRGQNMTVGIMLTELTEFSDTLNYKPFFKHSIIYKLTNYFTRVFIVYICLNKIFCSKNCADFYIFWSAQKWHSTLLKVFYKVFIIRRLQGIRDSLATAAEIC